MDEVLAKIFAMGDIELVSAWRASCLQHARCGKGAKKVHEALEAELRHRGIDPHDPDTHRGDSSFGMWENTRDPASRFG